MNHRSELLEVKIWGDHACFTRPETKVERVSYPLIPPSAARGVLEAIFWKPQISWRLHEIWVLQRGRHFSILRNEVNTRASARAARGWQKDGGGFLVEDDRSQRHALVLRDVAYLLRAEQVLHASDQHPTKYREQFERRVRKGQCFARPYLGTREFACHFAPPDGSERPVDWSDDLGRMLFDLEYMPSGEGRPRFFSARVDGGILRVPVDLYNGLDQGRA